VVTLNKISLFPPEFMTPAPVSLSFYQSFFIIPYEAKEGAGCSFLHFPHCGIFGDIDSQRTKN
jgi:hypothetical protein